MNVTVFGKTISLDHHSVGPRRSGSLVTDSDASSEDMLAGMSRQDYWAEQAGQTALEWAHTARDGAQYYVGGGVFYTCHV